MIDIINDLFIFKIVLMVVVMCESFICFEDEIVYECMIFYIFWFEEVWGGDVVFYLLLVFVDGEFIDC